MSQVTDSQRFDEEPAEKEVVVPGLRLHQLNDLESDSVNIQCIDSFDFVVGRQVNFNGPVTIVNCRYMNTQEKGDEEKIIIQDKVLSSVAAMEVQKMATEKIKPNAEEQRDKPKRQLHLTLALVCIGVLTAALIASAVTLTSEPTEVIPRCTQNYSEICIYSRVDWGGQPTPEGTQPLKSPVRYVIISQTHGQFCYDVDTCQKVVENFQDSKTKQPRCNFLVGGDGNAYEDRGWEWANALEGPAEGKALQICFLGNFTKDEFPTYPQVTAVKALLRLGVDGDHVAKDYVLAASSSTAPEDQLLSIYAIIKKWPNFNEAPFSKRANQTSVREKNTTNPLSALS